MSEVALIMSTTPARSRFKRTFGQANHFLITLIVGLEAIQVGQTGPALPAAWSPKDPMRSAQRSESFALQSAVVFLVAALDKYLSDVTPLARPYSVKLAASLDSAKEANKGQRGRVQAFADFADELRSVDLALVETAIHWRNRLLHSSSKARLNTGLRDGLLGFAQELNDDYRHLDPEQLIKRFQSREESPSFKEVAAMITATHRFIRAVDSAVLMTLDYKSLMESIIKGHLSEVPRDEAVERANRIWGRTELRARQAIQSLARQNGFKDPVDGVTRGLMDTTIEQLAGMSCRQGMAAFLPVAS